MKYLIACLGNIGPEHELTRHNIGFLVADRLIDKYGDGSFSQDRHVYLAQVKYKGRNIYVIKPTTYMNLSGKAVNYWLRELKLEKQNLLVVTDDIALDFGIIRMRKKGSAGGHNGLKNIEELNGGADYPRLRFGVGDDFPPGRQVHYVLSPFNKQEMDDIVIHMDRTIEAILAFCTLGIDRAMNQFNG
ncbi:pth [Symbiodinium microadriaticum]|nr:pth [Symbiodinium microadriaticum]